MWTTKSCFVGELKEGHRHGPGLHFVKTDSGALRFSYQGIWEKGRLLTYWSGSTPESVQAKYLPSQWKWNYPIWAEVISDFAKEIGLPRLDFCGTFGTINASL